MYGERFDYTDDGRVYLQAYGLERYAGQGDLDRPAILILPGGGYTHQSLSECEPVAITWAAKGYSTFILYYSCNEYAVWPDLVQEVAWGMKTIRDHADEWHINADQIAVMGFSAGGSLTAMYSTQWHLPETVAKLGCDSAYVKKYFVFEDFENGPGVWDAAASLNAEVSFDIDSAGFGREGKAAHFICKRDSAAQWDWALIGRELGGYVNLSDLDSIRFWVRVSTPSRISFSFDRFVNDDSVTSSDNIKSWRHFEADTVWTQFTVIPAELDTADSNGGNYGWEAVKDSVTKIGIFGAMDTEVWVDDIEVFGYGIFDPYAPVVKKSVVRKEE